ncbi:MAG: 1-(5-phosphoribosyl)-5-[(5-phosphoribosylamino)methylideneamino]imidazole-4-carboxamide isomerase [Acidimicrobiales bacterium]
MELFAAIDLLGGRCVRLVEGDFARSTEYHDDAVAVAESFAEAGAPWLHVVDLDAARTGDPVNRELLRAIASAVEVPVQVGGGVRSVEAAAAALDWGVARVVVGTAFITDPELVAEIAARWPGQVAVGLDHRDGLVRVRGWQEGSGLEVADLVPVALDAGASAVVVTDISRDGRLEGPDLVGLQKLLEATKAPVVASGGVATLDDLRHLASVQVAGRHLLGAVVGKALHERRFGVAEAVAACEVGPLQAPREGAR